MNTDGIVGIIASYTEGQSTRSDEIQVTVKDTGMPPPTPPDEITLAWDPNDSVEQVTEYRLYYKIGTSGPPYNGIGLDQGDSPITIRVNDLANENNPEFELTGLASGVTYRYVLTAFTGMKAIFRVKSK